MTGLDLLVLGAFGLFCAIGWGIATFLWLLCRLVENPGRFAWWSFCGVVFVVLAL